MKLLLTSDGITTRKIKNAFLKLLNKPKEQCEVLIMHTAKLKRHFGYIRQIKKQLVSFGFKKEHIADVNITKNVKAKRIKGIDVFYSCGGNTFYILNRVRKTGFDKFIKKFIKNNGVYIGVSAGSLIVHKTIELAGWGIQADKNLIKLKNLNGLNITKIAVFPHYIPKLKRDFYEFAKKVNYPVIKLTSRQALLILGKRVRKIQ